MVVNTLARDLTPPLTQINFSNFGSAENGHQILDALYSTGIHNLVKMSFEFNKEWFEDETCCELLIEMIMR